MKMGKRMREKREEGKKERRKGGRIRVKNEERAQSLEKKGRKFEKKEEEKEEEKGNDTDTMYSEFLLFSFFALQCKF